MKHLKVAILALLLVAGFNNVNAQDKNNPWAVGFGINAVDFYPVNPQTGWGGNWYNEFFNAEDHYNIVPAISQLSVGRYIAAGFSAELGGAFNKIDKIGDMEVDDLSYWAIDANVKWDIRAVINTGKVVEPYLLVGGGYTWMGDEDDVSANFGGGLNFWFNDKVGLNLQTKYRHTFDSNVYQHFQHSLGITFKMGGTDTDGDGVYDKFDACPDVFGLAEFDGCPDTDGDGIIDSEDACPNEAGLAEFNGCPDSDGDGIADKDDECPNEAGTKENRGCPDTDGDTVIDKEDACIKVPGPAANKGCPWPDTDGDGVLDKDDECKNEAGPASNKGCPEGISDEDLAKINELTKGVYFASESAVFTEEVPSKLDQIAEILKAYPKENVVVEGHCDSRGPKKYNDKLSEERAAAVKTYLETKGISADNMSTVGFGKDKPVNENANSKERAQNRRVEIKGAE